MIARLFSIPNEYKDLLNKKQHRTYKKRSGLKGSDRCA